MCSSFFWVMYKRLLKYHRIKEQTATYKKSRLGLRDIIVFTFFSSRRLLQSKNNIQSPSFLKISRTLKKVCSYFCILKNMPQILKINILIEYLYIFKFYAQDYKNIWTGGSDLKYNFLLVCQVCDVLHVVRTKPLLRYTHGKWFFSVCQTWF